jgi:hypothetical protein
VDIVKNIRPHWVTSAVQVDNTTVITARIYLDGSGLISSGQPITLSGWVNPNGTAVLDGNYTVSGYTDIPLTPLTNVVIYSDSGGASGRFTADNFSFLKSGMTVGLFLTVKPQYLNSIAFSFPRNRTYTVNSVTSHGFTIDALKGVNLDQFAPPTTNQTWTVQPDAEIQFNIASGTVGLPIITGRIFGIVNSAWVSTVTNTDIRTDIKISWPSSVPATYPNITGITPSNIQGNQNVYFSQTFSAVNGTGPYNYSVSGTLPTGLSWSTLTNVTTITLSGTPTQLGSLTPGFTITVTDSQSKTFSQAVSWIISNSSVITIATQSAGTNALSYNPNTGVLSFTPYLLTAATSSTLGGVTYDNSTLTLNAQGQLQYTLPTASTTISGGVKVDGTSIRVVNGVASIVPSTTALDARIRAIAIASAVAFGV